MQRKKVDIAVLGAGPGGYPAAIHLGNAGKKVALIESLEVGGTCLNRGCIPTKALVKGAVIVDEVRRAAKAGLHVDGMRVNWPELVANKDAVVTRLRSNLEGMLRSIPVDVIFGRGTLLSPREIEVQGKEPVIVEAQHIIIATGSEPKAIACMPFDYVTVHDSTSILNLTSLPKSITIIGGGAIGCEFAFLFSVLGVEVTIVEMLPRILPLEAETVSTALAQACAREKITLHCGEKVVAASSSGDGIRITLSSGKTVTSAIALVAAGRSLNTDAIGLDSVGVRVEKGAIITDDHMATNVNGVWAIGDVTAKYLYAHLATHQGLIAAENILGKRKKIYYNAVPGALFTRPEVGTVGYSLEEAKKQGFEASLASFPMQALGRAYASSETEGFVQVVFEEKTGRILGAQAVCSHASDIIAEMGCAVTNELTLECVSDTIHAHPTFAESWGEVAMIAQRTPVNFPKAMLSTVIRG